MKLPMGRGLLSVDQLWSWKSVSKPFSLLCSQYPMKFIICDVLFHCKFLISVLICFVGDLNTGGIVAGVLVALLAIALLCFAVWFANKKGYLPSKFSWEFAEKKQDFFYCR